MTFQDYEDITLGAFFNKAAGFHEYANKKEEAEWQRFGYVAYAMLMNNPHIKPINKPKSFQAFMGQAKRKQAKQIQSAEQLKDFIDFD